MPSSRSTSIHRTGILAAMACIPGASLHAQHGCIHSPEAPTGVLMLVGSAGMIYGSSWLRKAVQHRQSKAKLRNRR